MGESMAPPPELIEKTLYIFYFFLAIIALWLFWEFGLEAIKKALRTQSAPPRGPMKINITTAITHDNKYRLYIDCKMSQEDMAVIDRANFKGDMLFNYHSFHYDCTQSYCVAHLFNQPYVDFRDPNDCEGAKERLIEALYTLRNRIEYRKEAEQKQKRGGDTERLEI